MPNKRFGDCSCLQPLGHTPYLLQSSGQAIVSQGTHSDHMLLCPMAVYWLSRHNEAATFHISMG